MSKPSDAGADNALLGEEGSSGIPKGIASITELNDYYKAELKRLFDIGIALSAEKDLEKLLEMIVDEARHGTNADAGTLYILEDDKLHFKILQNESLNTRMGGSSGHEITFSPVVLKKENVSAYSALSKQTVNIPDVYEAEEFDFTGPRKFDKATGYRSKSMLVVPMLDQENEVIGVLQLINSTDAKTGEVGPFQKEVVQATQSLASQAAVAITTANLIKDMEILFDSFVQVMATAIDERSPYTGGHIQRVAELGVLMCEAMNEVTEGPFADVTFSKDKIKEMHIAGWMHDIGKVTTPVHIMDKSTKLETIVDRVEFIKDRFMLIEATMDNRWLTRKIELIKSGADEEEIKREEEEHSKKIDAHRSDLELLVVSNTGGEFMDPEKQKRVRDIGAKSYKLNGQVKRYLTDDEMDNLCIPKGTLLESERKLMQDHIVVTIKMLDKIPFPKHLSKVVEYAGGHHECLNGAGYPNGLKGDELSLGAQILNLVDFYEALTATDRPYKKPMPFEKAMQILGFEVKDGKIDKELFDLFVKLDIPGRFNKMNDERKKAEALKALEAEADS